MECGRLTAKLRDAVPVCFLVDGKEIRRYKNIEIPDEIKKLHYTDFRFDVPLTGAITFKIVFEACILPEVWPEARERKERKPYTLNKEESNKEAVVEAIEETATPDQLDRGEGAIGSEIVTEEMGESVPAKAVEVAPEQSVMPVPVTMTRAYNVSGKRHKEMASTISRYTGQPVEYMKAPTFSFKVAEYNIDKAGTVTGPMDQVLIDILVGEGFKAE